MAANIEHITRPLASPGTLKWSSADLYEMAGESEIVLTIRFSSGDLASEVYATLSDELQQDNFRLGSLNIRREG